MPTPEGLCFEKTLGRCDYRASDVGGGSCCRGRKDGEFWPPMQRQFHHVLSTYYMPSTLLSTEALKPRGVHSKPGQTHPSKAKEDASQKLAGE